MVCVCLFFLFTKTNYGGNLNVCFHTVNNNEDTASARTFISCSVWIPFTIITPRRNGTALILPTMFHGRVQVVVLINNLESKYMVCCFQVFMFIATFTSNGIFRGLPDFCTVCCSLVVKNICIAPPRCILSNANRVGTADVEWFKRKGTESVFYGCTLVVVIKTFHDGIIARGWKRTVTLSCPDQPSNEERIEKL